MSEIVIPSTCIRPWLINAGSGQRKFSKEWVNLDINPKWEPDVCCDMGSMPFEDNSAQIIVSHHTIEHLRYDKVGGFIEECFRVLQPDGSFLIFCPDMQALAHGWFCGKIDDWQYFVNVYGSYIDDMADLHRWGYTSASLTEKLKAQKWSGIQPFNWRPVPGAGIAYRDWWIMAIECIK